MQGPPFNVTVRLVNNNNNNTMSYHRRIAKILVLLSASLVHAADDHFLHESAEQCHREKDLVSCGKYKLLRYLDMTSRDSVLESNNQSHLLYPVQLVKIPQPDEEQAGLFPEARHLQEGSQMEKVLGFMQSRADRFLRTQGIAIPLPEGLQIVDENNNPIEGRGHAAKKKGLISLLTLLGVFKVKILVALVLVGLFFIKKVILLAALILPSVLHHVKTTCKHIIPYHMGGTHSVHGGGEEYHDHDYYGNYGYSGGYNKDWERRVHRAAAQGAAHGALPLTM